MSTETRRREGVSCGTGQELQWSRRRMSTETMGGQIVGPPVPGLQWSRRRMSTETLHIHWGRSCCTAASMEPSTNVDGDQAVNLLDGLRCVASMEPSTNVDGDTNAPPLIVTSSALQWSRRRMSTETGCVENSRDLPPALQWSRRRMSTETEAHDVNPVDYTIASMEPSTNVDGDLATPNWPTALPACFNGAVDECRRRQVRARVAARRAGASMEPSTNVDGDHLITIIVDLPVTHRFNGAVDECRRRRCVRRCKSSRRSSFNGAVDECRRRPSLKLALEPPAPLLQWSRRRMSTETAGLYAAVRSVCRLQWSRRRMSTETRSTVTEVRRKWRLQWSRRRMSTETTRWPISRWGRSSCFNGAVDECRRRRTAPSSVGLSHEASMEPSTNVDGDGGSGGGYCLVCALQWSRRRMSTETARARGGRRHRPPLQWSRRRMSTETGSRSRSAPACFPSFNGAVDECRRRRRGSGACSCRAPRFNGAVDECRRRPS